jgi:hypothetical protein
VFALTIDTDHCDYEMSAVDAYKRLWRDINGEKSWDINPWVWVVTFKIVP